MNVKDETSSSEEYKTNPYKSDNGNEVLPSKYRKMDT